jgi:hypothetical protein
LTCVSASWGLVCDAFGSFVEAITPPVASQTSCSDLP